MAPSSRRRPPKEVGADDKEPLGIEGLSGADHPVPPAESRSLTGVALFGAKAVPRTLRTGRSGVACRVGVAAQRMADKDDVVAC